MIGKENVVLYPTQSQKLNRMKTACILVLCSLSLISCQTDISRTLGRPNLPAPCIANEDGTCFRNGARIVVTNMECSESKNIVDIEEYLLDIELELYKCKKSPSRCAPLK